MKNVGGQHPSANREASMAFRTGTVVVSIAAALALVIDHGFRAIPGSLLQAMRVVEIVALALFLVRTALVLYWESHRLQRLRRIWYEAALTVVLVAVLIASAWMDDAAEQEMVRLLLLQVGLALFLTIRLTELIHLAIASRIHPAQLFIASFVLLIAVGTGLLMLPAAVSKEVLVRPEKSADGTPTKLVTLRGNVMEESDGRLVVQTGKGNLILRRSEVIAVRSSPSAGLSTALFTSTSAVCVTGLTVVSTGEYWSPFGQIVILALIQFGGLGIMTFGAVFALLLWQNLGFRQSVVMKDMMTPTMSIQVGRVLLFIVLSTMMMELLGTWLLWNLWVEDGMGTAQRFFYSLFHSVAAFCNAGFSLYSDSLVSLRFAWQTYVVIPALILSGGLGFLVFYNVLRICRSHVRRFVTRLRGRMPKPEIDRRRITLQSKLVLVTTLALLLLGLGLTWLFETLPLYTRSADDPARQTVMAEASHAERLAYSWFYSVTTRTAGFNVTPTAELTDSSKFLGIMLMFIGASPGSTGGGIKTATVAIILCAIWSLLHNRSQTQGFRRTIPQTIVLRSLVLLTLSVVVVVMTTLVLSVTQPNIPFLHAMFEATSAFGTVGLSTGVTESLNLVGRLVIIVVMFIGRVGPLTLFIALPAGFRQVKYEYPTESVAIG